MTLIWQLCLIYASCWSCWCCCLSAAGGATPLFVLLLDGLRWDYVLDRGLPNFARLRRDGASIVPLRPVYPTLCVPNIYSMFTGLYPHRHGLMGNENFDPVLNLSFTKASAGFMSHLEAGETLWDSLAHSGGRSLLYYLPGCSPEFAACARSYQELAPLEEVRDALLEGAKAMRDGYADLVVLYVDLLDWAGHHYGPEAATSRRRLLRQIDVLVGLAAQRVADIGGHLLVVGDHGMAAVNTGNKDTLERFSMHSDVARVTHVGAAVGVWPVPGRDKQLWEMIELMHASHPYVEGLTKDMLKSRFYSRIASHPGPFTARMPPYSMLVEAGHFLETFYRTHPIYASGHARGWHGYNPALSSMHTAALLVGPRARPGVSVNGTEIGAESLDLHPLMLHLLGLATPAAPTVDAEADLLAQHLLLTPETTVGLEFSSLPANCAVAVFLPLPVAALVFLSALSVASSCGII